MHLWCHENPIDVALTALCHSILTYSRKSLEIAVTKLESVQLYMLSNSAGSTYDAQIFKSLNCMKTLYNSMSCMSVYRNGTPPYHIIKHPPDTFVITIT
jgi:hypothetical protein